MKKQKNWSLLKPIGIGTIIGVIAILQSASTGGNTNIHTATLILYFYGCLGIPLGWQFIETHKPKNIAILGTIWFWVIWNILKLMGAIIMGFFLVPVQLYKFYKS